MRRKAIIIDIDGTIADCRHRRHFIEKKDWKSFYAGIMDDNVNENVAILLSFYRTLDYAILFVTGRPASLYNSTCDWLDIELNFSHPDYHLFMRSDGDNTPDDQLKKEIYTELIEPNFDVQLVLEDRKRVVKMWRSLGLECWQVAEGDF